MRLEKHEHNMHINAIHGHFYRELPRSLTVVPTDWLELTTLPGVTLSYVTINKTCNVNTEARSCSHCCDGRAASTIICVSVALLI